MEIWVESLRRPDGTETPHSIHIDGRAVAIAAVLDEWQGADHRYFKARGEDGNLYILRFDAHSSVWELILFRSPRGEELLR